jgi:hypothetical protein
MHTKWFALIEVLRSRERYDKGSTVQSSRIMREHAKKPNKANKIKCQDPTVYECLHDSVALLFQPAHLLLPAISSEYSKLLGQRSPQIEHWLPPLQGETEDPYPRYRRISIQNKYKIR